MTLFWYYFHVRRNSITASVSYITGTISFSLRHDRAYPKILAIDSVKQWPATFFYHRDIPAPDKATALPAFVDSAATPQESWDEDAPALTDDLLLAKRRIEYLMKHKDLKGSDLVHCWLAGRIQPIQHHGDWLMHSITKSRLDSLRICPTPYSEKDYQSQIKWLIKERI